VPPSCRAYSAGLPRRQRRSVLHRPAGPKTDEIKALFRATPHRVRRVRHSLDGSGSVRGVFCRGAAPRFRLTVFAGRLSHRPPNPGKTPWACATQPSFPGRATPTLGLGPCICPFAGITRDRMQPSYWFRDAIPTPRLSSPITFPAVLSHSGEAGILAGPCLVVKV
jgi:hypothetical protein